MARRFARLNEIGSDPYLRALEMVRCERDPIHWVNAWAWTYDPRETGFADIPFDLFPKQAELLLWLKARAAAKEDGLIEKSREVGATWLCVAHAVHSWLFRPGYKCGFGSRKLDYVDKIDNLDSIFAKIRFLILRLPVWMLPAGFSAKDHLRYCLILNPATGAAISGEGGDDIGRGGRNTEYFVDEAAFLERPQLVTASLSANTECRIDVSTPNGPGNPFARKRHSGNVPVFTLHWRDDPRKDQEWYDKKVLSLDDPVVVAQELDIDYNASIEGVVIPGKWVRAAVGFRASAKGDPHAGLDVAAGGKAKSVLVIREGATVTDVLTPNETSASGTTGNTTLTANWAKSECEKRGVVKLSYDCVGVGEGIVGAFGSMEQPPRFPAMPLNGGSAPSERVWPSGKTSKERFANLRAELWWDLRTRFEKTYERATGIKEHPLDECISIPNHPQLIADLSLPLCFETNTGKVQIESKADMARRGVKSPDHADALAYSFDPTPPYLPAVTGGERLVSQIGAGLQTAFGAGSPARERSPFGAVPMLPGANWKPR